MLDAGLTRDDVALVIAVGRIVTTANADALATALKDTYPSVTALVFEGSYTPVDNVKRYIPT